jgi:hypothetical protein
MINYQRCHWAIPLENICPTFAFSVSVVPFKSDLETKETPPEPSRTEVTLSKPKSKMPEVSFERSLQMNRNWIEWDGPILSNSSLEDHFSKHFISWWNHNRQKKTLGKDNCNNGNKTKEQFQWKYCLNV